MSGKKFEEDFKNSFPKDMFIYKLKDAGGWGRSEETRFTISNMCDYIAFDGESLLLLELKSTKGKSLPFTRIRDNQYDLLYRESNKKNVYPGVIINFRELEETYLLSIESLMEYKANSGRKSYPVDWIKKEGIRIEQQKKITRYRYDIKKLMKDIKEG